MHITSSKSFMHQRIQQRNKKNYKMDKIFVIYIVENDLISSIYIKEDIRKSTD